MLRIGICDDSQEDRFITKYNLERILEEKSIESSIYEFSSGDRFLEWFKKHSSELDLLFLDIEMPGMDGMETAKTLREYNELIQIVFVTSHLTYVFDGYSVGALGYLMKPAKETQIGETVERAMNALKRNEEDIYIIKNSEGQYKIQKSSILYFYSDKRTVVCVAKDGNYTFYDKLDAVEEAIGKSFVRIHQRYLVNGRAVERVGVESVVIGGEELPISRSYKSSAVLELSRNLLG